MSIQAIETNPIDLAIEAISTGKHSNNLDKKIAKIALLGIGLATSITARYFFYPVAHSGGISIFGDNETGNAFGYVFEVFYSKAFVTLEIWALYGILNGIITNKSAEEINSQQKASTLGKGCLAILTIAIATLARYPFALPAAYYNKSLPILALSITLVASVVIPIRSIQLVINEIGNIRGCNCGSTIASAKRKFGSFLEKIEASLSTKDIPELSAIQSNIELPNDSANSIQYLSKYFSQTDQPINPQTTLKITSFVASIILTGFLEYAVAEYTFYNTKDLILDSTPFAVTLAATSVLSTFYFYGASIYNSNYRFMRFLANPCTKKPSTPLIEKAAPITANILKIEELVTNIFAIGPWYSVWGSFYTRPISHWLLTPPLLLTLYMTLQAASCSMIDNVGLFFITDNQSKKAIKLISNLKRIKETIIKSKNTDFLTFFASLPKELQTQIYSETEISELNELIPLN